MAASPASGSPTFRNTRRSRGRSASAVSTITTSSPQSSLLDKRTRLQYEAVPVTVQGNDRGLHFVSWAVRPSAAGKLRFFAGPKDFNVLEKTDRDLVRAIHFGIFRVAGRAAAARR